MITTVAIIGGGFSGTITAVHLLRRGIAGGGHVIIANRSGTMARGVAYGTQSNHHTLNVPAGRMSAFEDDPESFVRFVRERGVSADGGTFVSRHLYGAYLEWLLSDAVERSPNVRLTRAVTEVRTIDPAADGAQARVVLNDGSSILADRVVLAVGNYPPETPAGGEDGFFSSRRYVADPWRPDALAAVDPHAPALLVGAGLTMLDIVLELQSLGMDSRCVAVSRRGLVPLPHLTRSHAPDGSEVPPGLLDGPASTRAYLRALRRHVRDAAARGVDWRDVVAALRPVTARLWHALSLDERRRFLRHLRPFWEVHRHRVEPQLHESFTRLQQSGFVSVLAARIVSFRDAADRVIVRIRPRGASEIRELEVGSVINCTGPAGDTRRLRDPLFDNLRTRGLLRPDPLGLGIDISPTGALIGADDAPSSTLYYVGPFARARDWEATAVPELRQYARQLADHLLESLRASRAGAVITSRT